METESNRENVREKPQKVTERGKVEVEQTAFQAGSQLDAN